MSIIKMNTIENTLQDHPDEQPVIVSTIIIANGLSERIREERCAD